MQQTTKKGAKEEGAENVSQLLCSRHSNAFTSGYATRRNSSNKKGKQCAAAVCERWSNIYILRMANSDCADAINRKEREYLPTE